MQHHTITSDDACDTEKPTMTQTLYANYYDINTVNSVNMVVINTTIPWDHFEDIPKFKFSYDTVDKPSQCVLDHPTPDSLSNQKTQKFPHVNTTACFPRCRILSVNTIE